MKKQILSILLCLSAIATLFTGCVQNDTPEADLTPETSVSELPAEDNDIVPFRPVDTGIQAQIVYEYPYLGLTATLPEELLEKIDSRDLYVSAQEDYLDSETLRYGFLRIYATTQAQKEETVMSLDLFAWEAELEKVGAFGVYHTSAEAELDALTGCDTHTLLGSSADGNFRYYLSTNSQADAALIEALRATNITLGEMLPLDLEGGYSACSTARIEGVSNVGNFTTEDIFGTAYDQTVFADYDLTLVNVFATWCSPCVEEIPELEKLRQEFEAQGIKLGIVAVVLDVQTTNGIDEGALERAKVLYERANAQFPFLLLEETEMNGRLTGIENIPESFFVDGNGNIVSEPYVGARDLADWTKIVETELEALK